MDDTDPTSPLDKDPDAAIEAAIESLRVGLEVDEPDSRDNLSRTAGRGGRKFRFRGRAVGSDKFGDRDKDDDDEGDGGTPVDCFFEGWASTEFSSAIDSSILRLVSIPAMRCNFLWEFPVVCNSWVRLLVRRVCLDACSA